MDIDWKNLAINIRKEIVKVEEDKRQDAITFAEDEVKKVMMPKYLLRKAKQGISHYSRETSNRIVCQHWTDSIMRYKMNYPGFQFAVDNSKIDHWKTCKLIIWPSDTE